MTSPSFIARLRLLRDHVEALPEDKQLKALKAVVLETGGRWDLPSARAGIYQPMLVSLQVYGIPAMAENTDELVGNWIAAATNVLEAADTEKAEIT